MTYVSEVLADSPVWWARLAEARGTSAADELGGAAGTYTGSYTLNQGSLLNAAAGDRGIALDGGSGCVTWPDSNALDVGDTFTLECWVYLTAYRDLSGVIGTFIDKGAGAYILRLASTADGTVLLRRNGTADIATSSVRLALNTAYHVVATKSGSTTKIYVNGADVTVTRTNSTMVNNALALGVGVADVTNGPNGFLPGRIDEPAIYRTALSAARVLAHYQAGVQVFTTAAVTGGGSVSASATKAARTAVAVTGGGAIIVLGKKAASSSTTPVTGGGFVTATGFATRYRAVDLPAEVRVERRATTVAPERRSTTVTVEGRVTLVRHDKRETKVIVDG